MQLQTALNPKWDRQCILLLFNHKDPLQIQHVWSSKKIQGNKFYIYVVIPCCNLASCYNRAFVDSAGDSDTLHCKTEKDKSTLVKLHERSAGNYCISYPQQQSWNCTIGILAGIWPCGTITLLDELFRAESKSQVYGSVHSFIHSNGVSTSNISKHSTIAHMCLQHYPSH